MRLFQILRIYRAFRGLKVKSLSAEIGISAQALTKIEDGQAPKTADFIKLLTWLMTEENGKPSEPEPKKEGSLFNGAS